MDLKIAVTPKGYDDIGSVIRKLGYNFRQLDDTALHDDGRLAAFDVVFINCSSRCESNAKGAQHAIRKYVDQGGTIYASDYAADYIQAAFSGFIQFAGKTGEKGKTTADIVDKGLRGLMGNSIPLTFDLGSWEQIKRTERNLRVYLESSGQPMLVSFEYGKGHVIYTCFHNHAQVSDREAELLRFLVLKPLMASATAELVDLKEWDKKQVQETVDTISPGGTTAWHEYTHPVVDPLTAARNWKGEAKFQLELQAPAGQWKQEGTTPPISIQIPNAQAGTWRYRVVGLAVPAKNFPIVIVIGPSGQVKVSPLGGAPMFEWNRATIQPEVDPNVLNSIKILGNKREDNDTPDIHVLDEH